MPSDGDCAFVPLRSARWRPLNFSNDVVAVAGFIFLATFFYLFIILFFRILLFLRILFYYFPGDRMSYVASLYMTLCVLLHIFLMRPTFL